MSEENSVELEGEAPSVEPVETELESDSDSSQENGVKQSTEEKSVQNLIKKLKLKVDGQEFEEDYDLGNEEQLIKDLQLARVAKKRMAEANEKTRKAFELTSLFDKDLDAFLEKHPNGPQASERLLLKRMQEEMMSPEERKMREIETKLAAYEQREKAEQERAEQERLTALETKEAQRIQQTIIDSLNKAGVKGATTEDVKLVAKLMHANIEHNLELSVDDLVSEYLRTDNANFTKRLQAIPTERLAEYLSAEQKKQFNKMTIDAMKQKQKGFGKQASDMKAPPPAKKASYMTPDQWLEETRRRAREQE